MNTTSNWIPFKYRHVFLFFIAMGVINVGGIYVLDQFQVPRQLSLFLLNSIGGGIMFSVLIVIWSKFGKTTKQKLAYSGILTALCTLCSYVVIYHNVAL